MFKKLQLQFTLFCASITCAIVLFMTLLSLSITEDGIRENDKASFDQAANSLITHLSTQSIISGAWISRMEFTNQMTLDIRDNLIPLISNELQNDPTVAPLVHQAMETAALTYALDITAPSTTRVVIRQEIFTLTAEDGSLYHALVASIPKPDGTLSLVALASFAPMEAQIRAKRIQFGVVALCAVLLLIGFAWFFTKLLLAPVEKNRKKQVRFIAAASHELRAPLTVILSGANAIINSAPTKEQEPFLNHIVEEGHRMERLISHMLTLAGADAHSWTFHPKMTDIDTLLLQLFEVYETIAKQKGIRFHITLPEALLPPCSCDPERLYQVISILIDNAFAYTPKGESVTLSASATDKHLRIQVADTGPGIPDDKKDFIFERFSRVDEAHHDKSHFGLGLSIAKEIVHLHKAQLLVQDTPGGGATFIVKLPL